MARTAERVRRAPGPDYWQASDGTWHRRNPGYWQAPDGHWYPPFTDGDVPPPVVDAPPPTRIGVAVTGFVSALIGVVLWLVTGLAVPALALGALGVVFSWVGWRRALAGRGPTGLAIAGLVLGAVALGLAVTGLVNGSNWF